MQRIRDNEIDRYEVEFRIRHADGHWVWLESKGKVFEYDQDGRPTRLVGIHIDITERKRLDIIKDQFVSTVSHELRTPLTSIYGSLDLLNHLVRDSEATQIQRLVTLAHDSCGRLTGLIDDILDLEKIAAGQLEYRLAPHSLQELVSRSVRLNGALADRFGVRFSEDYQDGESWVTVDDNRFAQIMANLLSNAVKFSPKGACVTISTALLTDETVRVSVSDQGSGIPESFQSRIFERFAQADSSSTRRVAGTGLGLSISKSIVEAFSGTIAFNTIMGEGTTFYFDLPVRTGEMADKLTNAA